MENQNNPQKDGFELLNKVIKSNEENIDEMVELKFAIEDLVNIVGHLESTARSANYNVGEIKKASAEFLKQLEQSINKIPKTIDADLSSVSISRLEKFEDKTNIIKRLNAGSASSLILSFLIMSLCFYFSKQWFSESIRAKTEIRQQILEEIRDDGRSIYKVKDFQQLQYNTDMMNKWMKAYPKEGREFIRFKKGFESR